MTNAGADAGRHNAVRHSCFVSRSPEEPRRRSRIVPDRRTRTRSFKTVDSCDKKRRTTLKCCVVWAQPTIFSSTIAGSAWHLPANISSADSRLCACRICWRSIPCECRCCCITPTPSSRQRLILPQLGSKQVPHLARAPAGKAVFEKVRLSPAVVLLRDQNVADLVEPQRHGEVVLRPQAQLHAPQHSTSQPETHTHVDDDPTHALTALCLTRQVCCSRARATHITQHSLTHSHPHTRPTDIHTQPANQTASPVVAGCLGPH